MQIRPAVAQLFHADGRTDRRTKLIVAFRNVAKRALKRIDGAIIPKGT